MQMRGTGLAVTALAVYIIGGTGCFSGMLLLLSANCREFLGWGENQIIGYYFLCGGLGLSVLGVLLMRIFRNRSVI